MDDTGFESMDLLTMCKFAEGDTRILMQKMARDCLKTFMKGKMKEGQVKNLVQELTENL